MEKKFKKTRGKYKKKLVTPLELTDIVDFGLCAGRTYVETLEYFPDYFDFLVFNSRLGKREVSQEFWNKYREILPIPDAPRVYSYMITI